MSNKGAAEQAIKDISKDFSGLRNTWYKDESGTTRWDTWAVLGSWLYTPENRKLNRSLGISILNSGGNRYRKNNSNADQ